VSRDGAQLLRTNRWLGKGERHRGGEILQVDGRAILIQEGIAHSCAAVDPQRHPYRMSEFSVVRVDLKHLRQLTRSVEWIQ
jgi:hypothetical protein